MDKGYLKKRMEEMVDRRNCLKLMGILGFGVAAPALIAKPSEGKLPANLHQVNRTRPLMGTFVNITIVDASRDKAEEVQEKAFARMTELVKIFDRHATDTPVSWLNTKGTLNDISPEIAAVFHQAAYFNHISKGAFDITVLPLVNLYKETFAKTGAPPTVRQIKEKMALVDYDKVKIDKQGIRFLKEGMQITLDGIAKGYIIDQAANLIERHGIKYALINAGGDIRAIGGNGPEKAWKVGIRDPWGRKEYIEVLELNNGAVATSGNYERYFDKDKRHHHIVDKTTGDSPRETISATVVAPTVMEADALSTTLFVLTPPDSVNLAHSLADIETMIIARGGRTFRSQGWKQG
ncbi:MAG: FAD:protein FMN transferase [Deltaproteobacteria bacterium]|nr:FAD:protein FMN transferase [Deltaproteobacteria bacterium]